MDRFYISDRFGKGLIKWHVAKPSGRSAACNGRSMLLPIRWSGLNEQPPIGMCERCLRGIEKGKF